MNKHLLRILFAGLLCMVGHNEYAQSQQLVVWMKSGEKVYYDLEEQPKTTFSGSNVVITTNTIEVAYPLEQVLRYTYENLASDIETLLTDKEVYVSRQGDVITFQNLHSAQPIQLFSADGKLLKTYDVNHHPSASISLSAYPTGLYIVNVNGVTYKMMKR